MVESKPPPPLPATPTVLVVASGPDNMVALVRAHVGSILAKNGLRVTSAADIPVLREKAHYGRVPMSWYDVHQIVPRDKAQVLVLVEVQEAGATTLSYYGHRQEQVTATFSIQALDFATGASVASPATGTVSYTALNMNENFRDAITSSASEMGNEIKTYWAGKRSGKGT